jgi:hypothetical protein
LGGADSQVHQHACNAAEWQFAQVPKAFMPNRKSGICDLRSFCNGF